MAWASLFFLGLVAALHLYFMVLEMFLWTTPRTRKGFGMSEADAETTKVMAKNQGLYNGFLVAGLVWAIVDAERRFALGTFFLSCVVIAGLYGAATASKRILFAQAIPGAIALGLLVLAFR
jgi:putative membrane protein